MVEILKNWKYLISQGNTRLVEATLGLMNAIKCAEFYVLGMGSIDSKDVLMLVFSFVFFWQFFFSATTYFRLRLIINMVTFILLCFLYYYSVVVAANLYALLLIQLFLIYKIYIKKKTII